VELTVGEFYRQAISSIFMPTSLKVLHQRVNYYGDVGEPAELVTIILTRPFHYPDLNGGGLIKFNSFSYATLPHPPAGHGALAIT
jgi:hypothetical protein